MLKLQYFGHLMQRMDSLENTLILGKIEGRKRKGWQRLRWLDGITDSMDMSLSKLQKMVKDKETRRAAVHGGHKESDATEWLNNKCLKKKIGSNKTHLQARFGPQARNLCRLWGSLHFLCLWSCTCTSTLASPSALPQAVLACAVRAKSNHTKSHSLTNVCDLPLPEMFAS